MCDGYYYEAMCVRVMDNMASSVYGFMSTSTPVVFRIQYATASFILGVATSVFGAWFPSRAASQLDPTLALHNIEARKREAVLGWRRVTVGLVLTLSSLALIFSPPSFMDHPFQFSSSILLILTF